MAELGKQSWDFVKKFRVSVPSWAGSKVMSDRLDAWAHEQRGPNLDRLHRWDAALADLGGDPCREVWHAFRPLHPRHETAWSDWLAWLFMTSRSGAFAHQLLKPLLPSLTQEDLRQPSVGREVSVGKRFVDILLVTPRKSHVQLEVKIWDPNWAKTVEAGTLLREKYGVCQDHCVDIILAPSTLIAAKKQSMGDDAWAELPYRTLPWESVATHLRRALLRQDELMPWMVWAHSLVGAIEQRLLWLPCIPAENDASVSSTRLAAMAERLALAERKEDDHTNRVPG